MRGVRELAAVMGALAVAVALVLLRAPSAVAGGPTSVLVVCPESAETAARYYSDKEYGQLQRLLGEPDTGSREAPPSLERAGTSRQINVTWLVHDVTPWRVDRVYPNASGTKAVWIHTAPQAPQSMNGYWHEAQQPTELRALLKRLGVMGKPSPSGAGGIRPGPSQSVDATAQAGDTPPAGTTPTPSAAAAAKHDGADWWWAIPGVAAGAALALALRSFVIGPSRAVWPPARWTRKHEPGPRQELRDV